MKYMQNKNIISKTKQKKMDEVTGAGSHMILVVCEVEDLTILLTLMIFKTLSQPFTTCQIC